MACQGAESKFLLSLGTSSCCHPQRFCVQPALTPGESVVVGMYLNTVACFPTNMFSYCPHGSEFVVALVHL